MISDVCLKKIMYGWYLLIMTTNIHSVISLLSSCATQKMSAFLSRHTRNVNKILECSRTRKNSGKCFSFKVFWINLSKTSVSFAGTTSGTWCTLIKATRVSTGGILEADLIKLSSLPPPPWWICLSLSKAHTEMWKCARTHAVDECDRCLSS